MKKLIFPGLLIGAAVWLFTRAKNNVAELTTSLTITPSDVSLDTSNILAPKVIINFQVNNPTSTAATINKIFATVTNNGNQLATINNNTVISIDANKITTFPIVLNIDFTNLISWITNGNLSTDFIVNGYAISGITTINFNKTISLPSIPSLGNNNIINQAANFLGL